MSANSLPDNNQNDNQTKNPNPPDPVATTSHVREQVAPKSVDPTAPPADQSNDTDNPKPRGRPAIHGLRRRKLFIAAEDQERFIDFRHHMIHEIDPQDHTERFFAEAIIAKRWLVLHADEAEAAAMRNAYHDADNLALNLIKSKSPNAPKDDDERYDRAIAHTCTNERVHLVLRYRTTHERAMFRYETALRQYRLTRDAGAIADQRRGTGFQPVNDDCSHGADRANVVNHWGQDMTLTKQPHDDGLPFGGSTPRASDSGLPINRSPDDKCGVKFANPLTTPVNAPSEISNQKSDSPNPHRKPNIADALADISRRKQGAANSYPNNDLDDHQTNCRNSPTAPLVRESLLAPTPTGTPLVRESLLAPTPKGIPSRDALTDYLMKLESERQSNNKKNAPNSQRNTITSP